MRFKTVDFLCSVCHKTQRVRISVPPDKEHHAHYSKQIIRECIACDEKRLLMECDCSLCKETNGRDD